MSQDTTEPNEDVTKQLRDLERQGGGMASLAHLCAGLLLAAFSLGSLISLSLAAFLKFQAAWERGVFDLPDGINVAVNVLLVLAMDIAMLYAASVIRVLASAGAPSGEQRLHRWVMIIASVVESSTYLYMLWQFDRPDNAWLWAIGIMRSLSAPGFAAYLSMARALPVAPRDIMYHSALASGKGVVRDVATLSADPTAPLHHKVRIFRAASMMSASDRARLDTLVSELSASPNAPVIVDASAPPRLPTGPGTPAVRTPDVAAAGWSQSIQLVEPPEWRAKRRTKTQAKRRQTLRGRAVRTGKVGTASYEDEARTAWTDGAQSVDRMMTATGMSRAAASKWVRTLKAETAGHDEPPQAVAQ